MGKKLWEASKKEKRNSNLYKFEKFLLKNYKYRGSENYKKLLNWSIQNNNKFWSSIWDFCEVKGIKKDIFLNSRSSQST